MAGKNIAVLLVEDDPDDALLIREMLETANLPGYSPVPLEITHCKKLSDGLACLGENRVDIILLDLNLPDSHGAETYERVLAAAGDVPVIAMTGLDNEPMGVAAINRGVQDYLVKGQISDVLLSRSIRYSLERHRLMKELKRVIRDLQEDLQLAGRVQRSLLPPADLDFEGIEFTWRFKPCFNIGGDILNIFSLGESTVGFYVLDVVGHGIRAAMQAVTLSRMLTNWQTGENLLKLPGGGIRPPAEVLQLLDERFPMDTGNLQCFTMIYGILDTSTGLLRYSRAGHQPILVSSPGGNVEMLMEGNRPVGWDSPCTFADSRCTVSAGSRLFLYTDGLVEAFGDDGVTQFGQERLLDLIARGTAVDLQTCVDGIMNSVCKWLGGRAPTDDMAILAIEIV